MARKSVGGAPRNGSKPEPSEVGFLRQPLDRPKKVADLSFAEVSEIKERRRLIEAKANEAMDLQKVVNLLRMEQVRFLQDVVTGHGLSLRDDHNIDSESGAIFLTATYIEPDVAQDEAVVAAAPVQGD